MPREESLFGEDFKYAYPGQIIKADPWPYILLEARDRIRELSGFKFSFAVGDRYLNGKDSIGWHADEFLQMGKRPTIASLSLGSTRRFKFKDKETGEPADYELERGSLLIMLPGCQDDWLHAVPKTSREVGERINWTFRPHINSAIGKKLKE